MSDPTESIQEVLTSGGWPSVVMWNRLEGRPRAEAFDRALAAEVRDPLWMLTRQWQFGEFIADDAGSPVFAKLKMDTTRLTRYQRSGAPVEPFDTSIPLEARVEREKPVLDFHQRLSLGYDLKKLLAAGGLAEAYAHQFRSRWPVALPPRTRDQGSIYAHPEVWQYRAAATGRGMDGGALYIHLSDGGDFLDGISAAVEDEEGLDTVRRQFVQLTENRFIEPPRDGSAWLPERLEYQFACSAPLPDDAQKVLRAEQYYHGHLDWYAFDIDPETSHLGEASPDADEEAVPGSQILTFIPTPVTYGGMPSLRYWEFEDGKTNFGNVNASTTDVAHLLLVEFALIYGGDWFIVPFDLAEGSLAHVTALAVTNVFGECLWIDPAGMGPDDDWQRWNMYTLNQQGVAWSADTGLFVPPTVGHLLESPPVEEARFTRDEMANMVWALEHTVPLGIGASKSGGETAAETRAFHETFVPAVVDEDALTDSESDSASRRPPKYRIQTGVPENWIPFIPVHTEPTPVNARTKQLQRAAMLRIIEGDPEAPEKIEPRSVLLRQNMDAPPGEPKIYRVNMEEVPRSGTVVTQTFQRCRRHDGKVCVWLGRRKKTNRGESGSGLQFDQLK